MLKRLGCPHHCHNCLSISSTVLHAISASRTSSISAERVGSFMNISRMMALPDGAFKYVQISPEGIITHDSRRPYLMQTLCSNDSNRSTAERPTGILTAFMRRRRLFAMHPLTLQVSCRMPAASCSRVAFYATVGQDRHSRRSAFSILAGTRRSRKSLAVNSWRRKYRRPAIL